MFEQEIKQYDQLAEEYLERIAKPMGDMEFRKHSEILLSCHSCGIEGSSFSVDDTRALFEQGLGYYPVGKTLLECQEMADHFKAYEWMHDNLDHPFDVALLKTLNRLVTQGTLPYRVPGAVPGEFTDVDMVAGDTLFGNHEKLIAQVPRLMESTARAMGEGNGRTGRLLSNFILLQYHLPELIILKEDRQQYISALRAKRTEGTDEHLVAFFFQAAIKQMQDALSQKKANSRPMLFF